MGNINEEINVVGALQAPAITYREEDDQSSMAEAQFQKPEKDPRTIARGYQIELCQKALLENIIVYLETGCGKTHIAVLLIYETIRRMNNSKKDICIFLAPTVALVEQQAKVIKDSIDVKVGIYCGSSNHLKSHHYWEKEMEQFEVLVMTPQILLHNLSHCLIRIQHIALLIFDECHYAQVESNHPYAEIMKIFYKPDVAKLPRIFGMTASPIFGKGASIGSLEGLLNAKVYTVDTREELDRFVSSPKVNYYYYGSTTNDSHDPHVTYLGRLETIKMESMLTLIKNITDFSVLKNTKKALQRLHCNLGFCLENLGLWGALQACRILLKGDLVERNEVIEINDQRSDDILCGSYLSQVAAYFASECKKANGTEADLSSVDNLGVPFFSLKLLQLMEVLSNFREQADMKCIIFVNRIITARSLAYVLQNIRFLSVVWRSSYLVGVHSGLKNMSRKTTNAILERFRSGELNLLVATKVGEEGLDIQTCCLVIRFDLPETVASFIQSRGRARMPQSEYAFLVDSGNPKEMELIKNFHKDEAQMNNEISSRTSTSEYVDFEEKTYKVNSTGAVISSGSSVSLLHRYCSKLPHDEFFNPKPILSYSSDNADATICYITLPPNAPIHQIISSPQPSREAAKKDACLKACQQLHQLGALTHYLLPDDEVDDENQDSSDSDREDEESSRRELHEMLVPSVLQEPWIKVENKTLSLNSYFIKFSPSPADRLYKDFGIFLRKPFPQEAERMKLDLHLARGRSVLTKIVPCGPLEFTNNEILLAERFQEMWLKAIIDKSEFVTDFVPLGKDDFSNSALTFYLLLPVHVDKYRGSVTVDWQLITKCLSSPVFKNPENSIAMCDQTSNMKDCLYLANGPTQIKDIISSLVYVPCKDTFYFVSDYLPGKNSFSIFKEDTSYVDHYAEVFGSQFLHPYQPLLKAKQLFRLDNLLRKRGSGEPREKEEHFVELPPEICALKVIGFSRDIGSTLSLLPSIMHRLESFLVAIELRQKLCASFSQGSEVSAERILEALTTERCNERFSLERLEVLGDAFLKFAVGRHLFLVNQSLDEGILTRKRSNMVNNSHLLKVALSKNLHVYIRDQPFEPSHFYPYGRTCSVICTESTQVKIHSSHESNLKTACSEVRCNKGHHWLQKKTIADIVEALVGAFLVDSGFKAAIAFLKWIGIPVDFTHSHVAEICAASTTFTALSGLIDISALENLLGYRFQHKGLLLQALLHPSYHNNYGGCYQRLEFLGDAVLDYLITSYLYSVYPKLKPGHLTDLRSYSVNNNSFAGIAVSRSFYKFMLCDSPSLTQSMNKYVEFLKTSSSDNILVETVPCPKALGDLVESCVGAILLDSGFNLDVVWEIMISFLDPVMKFSALQQNPIRELQELCQFYNWELIYSSAKKDRTFTVEALVNGKQVCESATAANFSKKIAKRIACQKLCLALKDKGYKTKMKSLEEILKLSQKMEAKLIGYDEIPTNINVSHAYLRSIGPGNKPLETRSGSSKHERSSNGVRRMVGPTPQRGHSDVNGSNSQAPAGDALHKSSAKSHLYEICASNCWKPPLFECFQETGPAHLKQFAFKVSLTIEDASNTHLECVGDHRAKKKDAAEFAARGAIWYLKQIGYLKN